MTLKSRSPLIVIALGVVIFALGLSCAYKPRAKGVENQIVVITSFEDKRFISPLIDSVFNRVIYTPEPEPYFEVIYADPSEFDEVRYGPNVVVVSLLSVKDSTADLLVKSLLPENQMEMVLQGENHVFATKDLEARGQVFAILVANNRDELAQSLEEKSRWLFDQFNIAFIERQTEHIFKQLEQKELSKELEQKYGWYLRIQHDYVVIKDQPERNFVWLGRSFPYRWLSIQWIENPITKELNTQIVSKMVHDYPEAYYKSVNFTRQYEHVEKTTFNSRLAWRIEGLWEHKKDVKGGPFVSYIFYDKNSDRIYHINSLIHHPSGRKMMALRQMDIMVHTFTIPGQ